MISALRSHWRLYLMEAGGLATFMISACLFVALLEYPASSVHQSLTDPVLRRVLIGAAMGATAIGIIYSPIGQRSGAHFNPAVTLADAALGGLRWREVPGYLLAQVAGAFAGVAVAHVMFEQRALFFASQHVRRGGSQLFSEFVATFGLLAVIWGCSRLRSSHVVAFAVGAYITAAYWFTASTSFANPAVTVARSLTDTFAGIRPADVPGFVGAQLAGAAAATALFRWLVPSIPVAAGRVLSRAPESLARQGTV